MTKSHVVRTTKKQSVDGGKENEKLRRWERVPQNRIHFGGVQRCGLEKPEQFTGRICKAKQMLYILSQLASVKIFLVICIVCSYSSQIYILIFISLFYIYIYILGLSKTVTPV